VNRARARLGAPPGRHALAALCLGLGASLAVLPAGAREASCAERAPTQANVDFVAAAARELPAVVRIFAVGVDGWGDPDSAYPFGSSSGERPDEAATPPWQQADERSSASGFVIRQDGYILTSAHAAAGAQELTVSWSDGKRLPAQIVGFDRRTDVALLKVAATRLPEALIAADRLLCPGEWVAALGSPMGFDHSLAAGVVSANPRYLPRGSGVALIQTDVALNRGSSGGPLFNARGEVVGMNSMIYSNSGEYVGLSFSLPIDEAMRVVAELLSAGHVTRGQLGAGVQALTPELAQAFGLDQAAGALVIRVDAGADAPATGLRSGDVILSIGAGAAAMSYPEIQQRVAMARPGTALVLTVWRARAIVRLTVPVTAAAIDLPKRQAARDAEPEERLGLRLVERKADPLHARLLPGLYVQSTTGSSRRAGIEFGDAIIGVNQTAVTSLAEFDAALRAAGPAPAIALLIRRGSAMSFVPVTRASGRLSAGD
jgi:serine protease Do